MNNGLLTIRSIQCLTAAILAVLLLQSCERSWTRACNAYIQAGQNRTTNITIGRAEK